MAYIRLLRPAQWVKNLFLFAGALFGGKLGDWGAMLQASLGFAAFCLLSSSIYILNDIHDREEDRLHPRKRRRPIAAGEISVFHAACLAVALLAIALGGSWLLDGGFFALAATYVALQLVYTNALKHAVLIDVIIIGLGFVIRAIAGAVLVHVAISPWLVLCTFTLCLFLGFSKRRCELTALAEAGGAAGQHRKTLSDYTPDLLNHMTTLSAGIAIVSFMLYAADPRTIEKFGTDLLIYTVPIVVYAIFRFALLVEHGRVDGPTEVMLRDRPFQAALLLWLGLSLAIVYRGREIRAWFTS